MFGVREGRWGECRHAGKQADTGGSAGVQGAGVQGVGVQIMEKGQTHHAGGGVDGGGSDTDAGARGADAVHRGQGTTAGALTEAHAAALTQGTWKGMLMQGRGCQHRAARSGGIDGGQAQARQRRDKGGGRGIDAKAEAQKRGCGAAGWGAGAGRGRSGH